MANSTPPRRLAMGGIDQFLAAGGNFLLTVLVARGSTPTEFGRFGAAFLGYLLVLGAARSMTGDPLLVSQARSDVGIAPAPLSALLVLVAPLSVALVVSGYFLDSPLLLAASPAFAAALLQDAVRYRHIAHRAVSRVAAMDGSWLFLVLVGGVVIEYAEGASWLHVLTWGAGALPGMLVWRRGITADGPAPWLQWWRRQEHASKPLLGEFALTRGLSQAATIGVASLVGAAAFAPYRVLQSVFGPLSTILTGLESFGLSELSGHSSSMARGRVVLAALAGTALTASYGAVLYALPSGIGTKLFGASWLNIQSLVLPVTAQRCASLWMIGFAVYGRSQTLFGEVLRARSVGAVLGAALAIAASATMGNMVVAAWALLTGTVLSAHLLARTTSE